MVDWAFSLAVAPTDVGVPGVVDGVAVAELDDEDPVPTMFLADTLNM